MADLKISQLPALAEADLAAGDEFAVVDSSASETKKITAKALVEKGVALIDAGSIPGSALASLGANTVVTASITDLNVTTAKIANAAITATQIANTTITGAKLVNDTVTATQIAANAITASELADNAVDEAAIVSNAVTVSKIANTTVTYAKLNLSDGDIPAAKIATNSLTANQIAADAIGSSELANNAVDTAAIANLAVTAAKIAGNTITAAQIANTTITATQIANNTITATQIAANAIGSSELADDAVDTDAIANTAVTNAKIANGTIAYAKLNLSDGDIPGAKIANDSVTATQIAANAVTASELADNAVDTAAIAANAVTSAKIATNAVTATELADDAVDTAAVADAAITTAKIADGAVTAAKLSGTLAATSIADDAVTTAKILDDAVTSAKIAAGAVDTTALGATSVTTAKIAAGAVTDAKVATGISGTKLTDGTVTAAKLNTSNIDRSLNVASGNLGINNTVSAATRSGITYNAQGLITATAALVAGDLPLATTSAVGAVSIASAGGLSVTGAGALSIAATTTGATATKVTFNNFGQITGTATLAASDLPKATASAVGAVSIPTGGPLSVDSNGAVTVVDSGVTAGTNTKVTVDAKGRVTALAGLADSDLPNHSAALLTSGSIAAARIGADTIDGTKLSNSSITIIQSIAQSGFPTAQFTGQLLFDSVAEDAYLWDGNAWQAITTLTKGSLVFGGTYNANTSQMVSVTSAGSAAGLSVGSNLPTASATTDGTYVVVSTSGTPSSPAPVVALAPPDYILGVTNTSGSSWNEVDLSQTVAGQVASNITFTPYGQLSSTNVQDALQELETEKMGLAGGTVTGQLLIGNTGTLVFEGSSIDAYETTIGVTNPTASDKTILFPDVSGNVITSGDTGTVTSTMIANATIVNADINASAAIAFSKLAALTSAQILVGNGSNVATAVAVTGDVAISNAGVTSIAAGAIVDADISGSAAITGSKIATGTTSAVGVLQLTNSTTSTSATTAATPAAVKIAKDAADAAATTANAAVAKAGDIMTGNLIIDNAKEIRFSEADSNGANYLALKAPASVTADITWTLPSGDGSSGQRLQTDGSGNLSWGTDNATDPTKLPLAGGTMSGAINLDSNNITNGGTITGTFVGNITGDVTGNADTATALATARTIGGVSFDGSANINLPGVNASGTQDTSGTAALATEFTVTANNSTDETVYPLFADGATGSQGAETDTGLTYNPSTGLLTSTSFAGNLTGNVTGNASGSAATVTGASQSAITSLGTLTGLTVSGNILMTGTGVLDIPVGTTGQRPGSPNTGMFRYNSTLNQFEGYKNTGWGEIGGGAGATGGSTDEVFMENDQTVTTNYTLGTNKNAVSVGNLTVNNGVTITIPTNATWVVL